MCWGLLKISCQSVKHPEAEFIMGEGDDKVKGHTWSFIKKFELKDTKKANARMVLGLVTGFLYTAAGMILEPQDRTGRVGHEGHEGLIDKTGRTEFTSRIFVPVGHG